MFDNHETAIIVIAYLVGFALGLVGVAASVLVVVTVLRWSGVL